MNDITSRQAAVGVNLNIVLAQRKLVLEIINLRLLELLGSLNIAFLWPARIYSDLGPR